MGNEDLSAVLFEKFSAEQDKYREWLLPCCGRRS